MGRASAAVTDNGVTRMEAAMAVLLKVLSCSEFQRVRRATGVAALATAVFTGGAAAADMPTKAPPPSAPSAYDWTGFYLGGYLGYAGGTSNFAGPPGSGISGALDLYKPFDSFNEFG